MKQLSGTRWKTAAITLVVMSEMSLANVGDELAAITPQPSGVSSFCAIGLAFDGVALYVNRCGDHKVYRINPQSGGLLGVFDFTDAIPERPSGMAYDGKRHGLWIGTQKPAGIVAFDGCCERGETPAQCASQSRVMPVYFWNFATGSVELRFSVPVAATNPVTGRPLFPGPKCVMSGVGFVENGSGSDADDEIWVTDDLTREIIVLRTSGIPIRGYDATKVNPSLFKCSGLGVGADLVYLSNQDLGDVFRSYRLTSELPQAAQAFVETTGLWQADMECDAFTFAPKSVMWVRTSPQGNPANDRITAYEIEPGGCGPGIPIGACCDAASSSCRDVPQVACSGTWTQGILCANLDPPCFPKHRIYLLDRTGSMQALTSTGQTRCERALQTMKDDVNVFFNTAPIGSSVAVWTFAGAETTALTAGFVDKTQALLALDGLDPVGCGGYTPLAESICEAVDFVKATFPTAPWPTLEISISSDGNENNSDGECDGPQSTMGNRCTVKDPGDQLFDVGSWQEKVCAKIQNDAVFLAMYWGPSKLLSAADEIDAETGLLRGSGVSDLAFFQALATTTGGHLIVVPEDDPVPSGPSIFGVQGACCLPIGECRDDVSQAECASLGGTHRGENSTCDNLPTPCPAVSQWGVKVLALVIVVCGTVLIRRRKAVV